MFSQSNDMVEKERIHERVYNDGIHIGKAVFQTYKKPLSWKKKEWKIFGAVLGTAALAYSVDESINSFFRRNQSKHLDPFADFGDFVGQPEHQGPFLAVFLGSGFLLNNQWMRETASMIAATMITSGSLVAIGKETFGRTRPSFGKGNNFFKPFGGKLYHSLPSAHTALGLSSFWVLARQTKPLALKIPFYTVPAIVAWSRLYDNAHWLSDVVLSSAIAIGCAEAVMKYYTKVNDGKKQVMLSVAPSSNGLAILYRF